MAAKNKKSPRIFGGQDYRDGAWERLSDSGLLLRSENFSGSVYLGGRAVESMLRAEIWFTDKDIMTNQKPLETGHDLAELLSKVANLGLLKENDRDDEFRTQIQRVAQLWFNNMRFASSRKVEAFWRESIPLNSKYTLKKAAADFYDACSGIVKRCEALL